MRKQEKKKKKGSNLLEGLLLGGLIGAALGMLFAPAAGDKARGELKNKLKELGLGGMVDRLSEAFEEGREEMDRVRREVEM